MNSSQNATSQIIAVLAHEENKFQLINFDQIYCINYRLSCILCLFIIFCLQ